MSTFPESPRSAFLEWCQGHTAVFSANAAAIGLTSAQATAFTTATTAAANALLSQQQTRQEALVATQAAQEAFSELRSSAGDVVRLIRAFAESQGKPSIVYNLAQIPPPATPAPMPPPGQPTDLTITLTPADGALQLRWKCVNPPGASGTSYLIRRRLPGQSEWTFLGVSGRKDFVDDTLNAGPDSVQYTVQGQRSGSTGPLSAVFTVYFGRMPGGGFSTRVTQEAEDGNAPSAHLDAAPSTVNGRAVQKVLPGGNAHAARNPSRG
ncbi:MAG: hypothetical protein HRU75_08955 [Planctomycetia bacterium]|nr:MAG: hypothetical protein HRU75_08955 [Planctomycetia bacterium]